MIYNFNKAKKRIIIENKRNKKFRLEKIFDFLDYSNIIIRGKLTREITVLIKIQSDVNS